MFRAIYAAFALLLAVSFAGVAHAADLNYSTDENISLASPAITLVIKADSVAKTLIVNAGSVDVTMATSTAGVEFSITSASRELGVSGGSATALISNICTSAGVGKVVLRAVSQEETFTITPKDNACGSVSTGGGSGGGGGGGATPAAAVTTPAPAATTVPSAPVTIPALPSSPTNAQVVTVLGAIAQQVAYIQANLAAPNALALIQEVVTRLAALQSAISGAPVVGGSAVPPAGAYAQGLAVGAKGGDVTALQNFLKAQGSEIYPEGLVTGYFGSLTRDAIGRFQLKQGIVTSASDPGYGTFGPKTRAKVNSLLGQ